MQVALFIAGIALFAAAVTRAWSRWKRRGWQETDAEVLYNDIRPAESGKPPGYVGVCILTYTRDEQKFIGQFHFTTNKDYTAATHAARRYAAGSAQRILVRPGDPQAVQLQSANTADTRLALACALLGCLCTAAALTWFRNV